MATESPPRPAAFAVSDVAPATQALPEVPPAEALSQLRRGSLLAVLERDGFGQQGSGILERRKQAAAHRPDIEAVSDPRTPLLGDVGFHPFLAALHFAFCDHRPLCLTPDAVWLLICQGVANHINAAPEEARAGLVKHAGRVTLSVQRDDFRKGASENRWEEVFPEFTRQIRDHVGEEVHDFFTAGFSTTGPAEKAAFEIALMDAMHSYFEYRLMTLCGIPAIRLEGAPEDWRAIAERARGLGRFGLPWWGEALAGILEEFVAAAEGHPRRGFWESIYKYQNFSGGNSVTGWITAFFPYLKPSPQARPTVVNELLQLGRSDGRWGVITRPTSQGGAGRPPGPPLDVFPSGLSCAPLVWEFPLKGARFDMEFLGGFIGVSQDPGTLTLRPEIGWAVRDVDPGWPGRLLSALGGGRRRVPG